MVVELQHIPEPLPLNHRTADLHVTPPLPHLQAPLPVEQLSVLFNVFGLLGVLLVVVQLLVEQEHKPKLERLLPKLLMVHSLVEMSLPILQLVILNFVL